MSQTQRKVRPVDEPEPATSGAGEATPGSGSDTHETTSPLAKARAILGVPCDCEVTPDEAVSIRDSLGLSREEFASLLHSSKQSVAGWEQGANQIRGTTLVAYRVLRNQIENMSKTELSSFTTQELMAELQRRVLPQPKFTLTVTSTTRKVGRPRKVQPQVTADDPPKRKRGRPRKS